MPGQHYSEIQQNLIRSCLRQIEDSLNWGESNEWRNDHFQRLSDLIYDQTGTRLSIATLKRVWGRIAYSSLPSMSTLNALVQYLGYQDWISFQAGHNGAHRRETRKKSSSLFEGQLFRWIARPGYIVVFLGLIVAAALLVSLRGWPQFINSDTVKFEFEPVTSGVPNTVVFNYDVSETKAESVSIQQSWDPKLRHEVDINEHTFTSTYYIPGFFKAKLLLDEQIVQEKDLYIKSNGWIGTIDKDPIPFYLDVQQISEGESLAIRKEHLIDRGIDLNESVPITQLHLVDDFGDVPATDFSLHTEFRHTLSVGETICQQGQIIVICSETPFMIPFSIKGCVGELHLYIPGKGISGESHDLSGFGLDFEDWVTMDLKVNQNLVSLGFDNKMVFQDSLDMDPGKLVGIRYKFHGTGSVHALQIRSQDKLVYDLSQEAL